MNKLKFWRTERRLSQVELAAASNLPRWTIQLIESGVRNPDKDQCKALAKALGLSVEKLFPASKQYREKDGDKK